MLNLSDIITATGNLSSSELEQLASELPRRLAGKQATEKETQEDLSIPSDFSSISETKREMRELIEQYFTEDFINRYRGENAVVETDGSSSITVSKKIGSLKIIVPALSEEEDGLTLQGISQEKCRILLRDYFQLPTRQLRGDLPELKTILAESNEAFTPVNLFLGKGIVWKVRLYFNSVTGLQFLFDQKVRGDLQKRKEALVAKLRDFIEEEYHPLRSAFNIQLSINSQTVALTTESSSSEKETSSANNEHTLVSDSLVTTNTGTQAAVTTEKDSAGKAVERDSPSVSVTRSSDSSIPRGAIVSKDFYVKATVDERTAGLSLAVGTARPGTYLGRRQGAHITAYIVFVTAILEAVDEQSIHEIPDLLLAIAKQFVTEEHWEELDKRAAEMHKNSPAHFDRDYRKALTAELRQKSIDEKTIQELKKSMKIHHATLLANLIDDLSNQVLIGVNQNESVLYLRPGKTNSAALGAEGAKIKAAMQGLRAIQFVVRYQGKNPEAQRSLLEEFKQSTLRQGLKPFLKVASTSAISDRVIGDFFTDLYFAEPVTAPTTSTRPSQSQNAFFKNISSIAQDKIERIACSTLQVISNLVFDLFDFDCYEYIVSLLFTELIKVVADKYSRKNINKPTYENTLLAIEALENAEPEIILRMFYILIELNFSEKKTTEAQNVEIGKILSLGKEIQDIGIDIKTMFDGINDVASRDASKNILQHFEFVILNAFSGLGTLPIACQQYMYQTFVKNVQKEMHWEHLLKDISENFSVNSSAKSFAQLGFQKGGNI